MTEADEVMLPGAFFLQRPKEAFDHSVLLRRVRRDEFLAQPVVATRRPEPLALEDQAVVRPDDRRLPCRAQGAEAA